MRYFNPKIEHLRKMPVNPEQMGQRSGDDTADAPEPTREADR